MDGAVDKFGLTKTWSGDIRGTSTGIMLAGGDPATGDAGYVAIEVVRADLGGREGTFLLQQFGAPAGWSGCAAPWTSTSTTSGCTTTNSRTR
ncbi:Protein of uncharacterised function (DUF3224) [Mycobacteroides abscessus subsp. abscessus]|nr:Protein of uncharacterised function (DUF3224) [Mycobacteroides abscessus subsp. abscessus]